MNVGDDVSVSPLGLPPLKKNLRDSEEWVRFDRSGRGSERGVPMLKIFMISTLKPCHISTDYPFIKISVFQISKHEIPLQ